MTNINFKFQVLQVASAHNPGESAEGVIERAKLYMEHLVGVTEDGHDVLPPAGTDVLEPGVKRKRRTKAEIEADAKLESVQPDVKEELANETQPTPPPVPAKGKPGIPYTTIQQAVVTAVDINRRDAVVAALKQFGVKTALELQAEQYQEFMDLLNEGLSEPPIA